MQQDNSIFKKSIATTASFASIIGVLSDLGTPIADFTLFIMIISIVALITFGILYLCSQKRKTAQVNFWQPSTFLTFFVSSLIACVILTALFVYKQAYPDTGIIAGNFEPAKELQQTLFNISDKQDKILESQQKMQSDVRDIKEIVSGESEIKNLSNVGDMSIVEELNEVTKDANAISVAITYFDNTGEDANMDKLKKGLADMLISDLSNVHLLNIVERDKLESILAEQKLSHTANFDASTAAKIGKLLGAKQIVVGSYFEMFGSLRIDARFVDVETGSISKAEGVEGETSNFFKLEKSLVWKLIRNLDVKLLDKETEAINSAKAISYEDFEKYSEALNLYDKGDTTKSKEIVLQLLTKYPDLQIAKTLINKINSK
jgi:TolB-like protein